MAVPFQSDAERAEMFQKMDENGDGSISFDEWLSFSIAEIIAKVAIQARREINYERDSLTRFSFKLLL